MSNPLVFQALIQEYQARLLEEIQRQRSRRADRRRSLGVSRLWRMAALSLAAALVSLSLVTLSC